MTTATNKKGKRTEINKEKKTECICTFKSG